MIEWYHDVPNQGKTKFIFRKDGLLERVEDRNGGSTKYAYHLSGFLKSIQYPDWKDDQGNVPGKIVEFTAYDYLGRLFSARDSEGPGTSEFIYDEAGNWMILKRPVGSGMKVYRFDEIPPTPVEDSAQDYE